MTSTKQNLFIIKIEGMLQANELRIGNWVNNDGYYEQVDFTDIADLSTGCGGAHLYKPIVLTPEILEKAGWQLVNQGNGPYYWHYFFIWFHVYMDAEGELRTNWNGYSIHLESVHQLQNLIHSLTGTELNINL